MQQVEYLKTPEIPLEAMWGFVKDFDNWAPMLNRYQRHQTLNDRESIWEAKGTIGNYRRQTKLHSTITDSENATMPLQDEVTAGHGRI